MLASNTNQIHDEHESHQLSLQFIDYYNFDPFLDEDFILSQILYTQKQQFLDANNFEPEIGFEISVNNTNEEITQKALPQKKPISRKRSSNKDRHSKICTSKGPRDRRMRLSIEIARSFFDLQDMLGFDKASKTVEWLFAKSRSAIKELKEKFLSEGHNYNKSFDFSPLFRKVSVFEAPREKKRRKLRVVDKESRSRARARARERTRAKIVRRLEISKCDFEGNPIGDCMMGDVSEEIGTKNKIFEFERSQNERFLSSNVENSADDHVHLLPCSSMDMSSMSLDSTKASPAGLKLLELDEIDGVLIFYGE
ncbi:transcription factor TCP12-like [Cucurbita pepo subsp. pepo]|uniref:transcription factor TCP12-like n=1 Tax=Cucurbita pepo subsp. pepo TaxID=3664 RepID=UPI000C9DA171|nr:transcription factor TCP12-like [Cucurbita pepo subsp. pepo]